MAECAGSDSNKLTGVSSPRFTTAKRSHLRKHARCMCTRWKNGQSQNLARANGRSDAAAEQALLHKFGEGSGNKGRPGIGGHSVGVQTGFVDWLPLPITIAQDSFLTLRI